MVLGLDQTIAGWDQKKSCIEDIEKIMQEIKEMDNLPPLPYIPNIPWGVSPYMIIQEDILKKAFIKNWISRSL